MNRFGFSPEKFCSGSQTSIFVSRVKNPEEINFLFFSSVFFRILSEKNFRLSAKKTSRSFQIYPLRVQTNNFWIEIFFKSFEPFWIFSRNLWQGSQSSIYVSRVKFPEDIVFFHNFFRILCEKFFRLSAKKLQEVFKTTLYSFRGTVCGLNFFSYFRIVLVFLQKHLAWFSKFYLRVQSKNCGRNIFLIILSNNFWIEIFFQKFWTVLDFLQKPLAGFSKFYLRVQSKISGRNRFLNFSFQKFFQFWAKHFQLFGRKNFKKLSKLPSACSNEQFLAWNFFQKFWTVLDFLQKPLAWFSNIYLRVQIKNSGRIIFFILLFRVFFGFWAKIFPDFWPENFKKLSKLPSACSDEQFLDWNFFQKFWTILDFLQKTLQWFSDIYLRVQSKNSGRNIF